MLQSGKVPDIPKRVNSMFMGEYSHTIDTKGRLIIPSKFREDLGEEFVVTKGLDGCLSIYPLKKNWKLYHLPTRMPESFHDFSWQEHPSVSWIGRGGFSFRRRCGNLQVWKRMWYLLVI